jgi:hypothetical protein
MILATGVQHASACFEDWFVLDEKRCSTLSNTIPILRWHLGHFDAIIASACAFTAEKEGMSEEVILYIVSAIDLT